MPTVPGPFPMERTGRFPLAPDCPLSRDQATRPLWTEPTFAVKFPGRRCSGPEGISPYGGVTVPDVHASTQEERNGHDDQ